MAILNLNLTGVETQEVLEAIPAGSYEVMVKNTQIKMTKSDRAMLVVDFEVVSGMYAKRHVFENFVLGEPVAMIRLKTLAAFSGHPHPDNLANSEELHGRKCTIVVTVKTDDYGIKNSIKGFKKPESTAPALTAPTIQAPVAAPVFQTQAGPVMSPVSAPPVFQAPAQAPVMPTAQTMPAVQVMPPVQTMPAAQAIPSIPVMPPVQSPAIPALAPVATPAPADDDLPF